ncbi:hypothetical protein Tco_1525557 [Tanacetum coccineum]
MLCYLTGMEPYYIKCIKDGPYQPKTAEGANKPESQWTPDERRVVNQDQRLKSIIISCIPDDIMKSVIRCETTKSTWNDLGLRNANHTQTLELADIHERFVYEENLISRRYPETKKALITTPSDSLISTAFFFNNIVQDFQENYDDEADVRTSEEYLEDLELKSSVLNSSLVSKGFQPKFTPKLIQSSQHAQSSQSEPQIQKDYKAEYKKMKAKLALLEEEVFDDEEMTHVKVLMALADDELTVGKNHARNGDGSTSP